MGYKENKENDDISDLEIMEAKHKRKNGKKDIYDYMDMIQNWCKKNKTQFLGICAVVVVAVLVIVNIVGGNDGEKDNTKKETTNVEGTTAEESVGETEPQLTITAEAGDSELATLIGSFYHAYIISGDVNEVSKYIDSTTGIDGNRLSVNKKYIEQVSDFQCYKSDLDIIDEDYTVLIVTYKTKLYNYSELLPSIDILFLVNGDDGYRVHNLTVDDEFDKQKIENDSNFQILAQQVSDELNGLLAANAELNEVYNLYLNPVVAAE